MFDNVIIKLCIDGIMVINLNSVVKIFKYLMMSDVFLILSFVEN